MSNANKFKGNYQSYEQKLHSEFLELSDIQDVPGQDFDSSQLKIVVDDQVSPNDIYSPIASQEDGELTKGVRDFDNEEDGGHYFTASAFSSSVKSFMRMKTVAESKEITVVNDETTNSNLIFKQFLFKGYQDDLDKQSLISQECMNNSTEQDNKNDYAFPHQYQSPKKVFGKKSKNKNKANSKKVKFRDEVYPGTQLTDVFIVENFKLMKKQQEDEDEGKISCACTIF